MGLQDLEASFDRLDRACIGFLTSQQLRCFYEEMHFRAVAPALVDAAVTTVCGEAAGGRVRKAQFVDALLEVDRRLAVEEQAYWDFQALDQDADGLIAIHDAFLLCQEFLGDGDFLAVWRQFLASRDFPEDNVHLDELRPWLCELPRGARASQEAVQEGEAEALKSDHERCLRDYEYHKFFEEEDNYADERNGYIEKMKHEAERKLIKWKRRGLEAMLLDDGELDDWKEEARRDQKQISLSDVLQLLQTKYGALQDLVLTHMAQEEAGDEKEAEELRLQLQQQFQGLARSPELHGRLNMLPGSDRRLPHPLAVLMEDLSDSQHLSALQQFSAGEISAQCTELFRAQGPTCGEMLQQLLERYTLEQRRLLGGSTKTSSQPPDAFLATQFLLLLRQMDLLRRQAPLVASLLAVGQAERLQSFNIHRKQLDRARQEVLARYRLEATRGRSAARTPRDPVSLEGCLDLTAVAMWERVMQEVVEKHHWELEAAMEMTRTAELEWGKLSRLSDEERSKKVTDLRNQYHNQRASVTPASDQPPAHVKTLQDGVTLLYCKLERELGSKDQQVLAVAVLASIQQQQETEVDLLLHQLLCKTPMELVKLLNKLNKNRVNELFDNIAIVVFGAAELDETDKKCLDIIDDKYDLIREKIFNYILRERFGDKLSAEDRDQRYAELKQKEAELRGKGQLKEMESLLGQRAKNYPSLQSLMGENKTTFKERMTKAIDKDMDLLRGASMNLLADVVGRCKEEREWFWSSVSSGQSRESLLLQLQLERFHLKLEGDCEMALLALGLLERVEACSNRHKADRHRQSNLATKRMEARQPQVDFMQTVRQFQQEARSLTSGVGHKQRMLCLKSHMHARRLERMLLMQLLLDEGLADLTEAAAMMDSTDCHQRLQELLQKCSAMDLGTQDGQEEYYSVLEECAALKVVCLREEMLNASITEMTLSLLLQLQQLQDKQLHKLLVTVQDMTESDLEKCISEIWSTLTTGFSSNVLEVLTSHQEPTDHKPQKDSQPDQVTSDQDTVCSDQDLISALDSKYDAMRDKMLAEALMKELGEAEWLRLSEKERQRRLTDLRIKERQLRKEGKYDELAAIFGNYLNEKDGLEHLLEENRLSQRQRFEERLRAKQKLREAREAAGLSTDDDVLEEMVEEEEKQSRRKNILLALDREYDAEKEALFDQLGGEADRLKQERQRQFALAKLRAEEKRLKKEDNADSALLLLTLVNQHSQRKTHSVEQERERQHQLARERLEARRLQRQEKGGEDSLLTLAREPTMDLQEVPDQEDILTRQNRLEEDERQVLLHLMEAAAADSEVNANYQNMSSQELVYELSRLQQEYSDWRRTSEEKAMSSDSSADTDRQQGLTLLTSALAARLNLERQLMVDGGDAEKRKKADEELQVALLADLQTKQLNGQAVITSALAQADETKLDWLRKVQRLARQEGWYDNVATVVFTLNDPDFVPQLPSTPEPSMEELHKQSRTLAERDNLNPDEVLKNLQDNQEAKNQVIQAEYERQRRRVQEQLAAARASSNQKDEVAFTTSQLLRLAESQAQATQTRLSSDRDKQRSLLQDRLAARRQARQKTREAEAEAEAEAAPTPDLDTSRPPSQMSLRREKSQLVVEVTEDEKNAVYNQLVRQQVQLHSKISQQQSRQEEMLKRRLEARKGRRENEAAALFSLGERQKTFLEQSKKENRERQIAMVQGRVARMRNERTTTSLSQTSSQDPSFGNLAEEEGDDKMEERAQDLESRLRQMEEQQSSGPAGALSDKDRFKMIKERRRQMGKPGASGKT